MTKAERLAKQKEWLAAHAGYYQRYQNERHLRLRYEALQHYGMMCGCCGESELVFLCIDHVNDDGGEERRRGGKGTAFLRWLAKNDWPAGYQTLCHNCNYAKSRGGCPHQATEQGETVEAQ